MGLYLFVKLFHFGRPGRQHVCRRISKMSNILSLTSDSWTFIQSSTIPITQGLYRKSTLSNNLPFTPGLWTSSQFSTIPKAQLLSQNLIDVQHSAIDFRFLDFSVSPIQYRYHDVFCRISTLSSNLPLSVDSVLYSLLDTGGQRFFFVESAWH